MRRANLTTKVAQLLCALSFAGPVWAEAPEVAKLKSEGVQALHSDSYDQAIRAFEGALKLDPTDDFAKEDLAIAHNGYGSQLQSNNPKEALKHFHEAMYLAPDKESTKRNIECVAWYGSQAKLV